MTTTARPKTYTFPLGVEWLSGRRVAVEIEGKQPLEIVPPPEFRGPDPTTWSPEDLFVASAAACLAVTYTGLLERAGIALERLHVAGEGDAGMRDDGRFGFREVRLRLAAAVPAERVEEAHALAEKAEATCLVSASFALPVHAELDVRPSGSFE